MHVHLSWSLQMWLPNRQILLVLHELTVDQRIILTFQYGLFYWDHMRCTPNLLICENKDCPLVCLTVF